MLDLTVNGIVSRQEERNHSNLLVGFSFQRVENSFLMGRNLSLDDDDDDGFTF